MPLAPIDEIIMKIITSRMKPNARLQDSLSSDCIIDLLESAYNIFDKEPILVDVPAGIHVVGDIHGNIDDLLRIFQEIGYPPDQKYVFLGDYEDRGKFGLEVVLFLFALKIRYPQHIFMIRGNHEIMHVSKNYGFDEECQMKYNSYMFSLIHTVFNKLPFLALIHKRILCVHGGISPELSNLREINKMMKPNDLTQESIFVDLVWSDPKDMSYSFKPNARGCGYYYNATALEKFLKENDLDLLIRSHELCDGYSFPFEKSEQCLTVFSNTDYCGRKNNAAVINVSKILNVTVTKLAIFNTEERSKWRVILPEFLVESVISESNKGKDCYDTEEPNSEIDLINSERKNTRSFVGALVE